METRLKTPQARLKIDEVRKKAWDDFKSRYPKTQLPMKYAIKVDF